MKPLYALISHDGGLWTVVFRPEGDKCTHQQVQGHGPEVLTHHVKAPIPLIDLRSAKSLTGLCTEVREAQAGAAVGALPTLDEFIARARAAGATIATFPPEIERPRAKIPRIAVEHERQLEILPEGADEPADGERCCPDCGQPNQFGEVCPTCQRERGIQAAEASAALNERGPAQPAPRRLELQPTGIGQWNYRVDDGPWVSGPYDRDEAIALARRHFGELVLVGEPDARLAVVEADLGPKAPAAPALG
jgi:hypothetical protein